VILSR